MNKTIALAAASLLCATLAAQTPPMDSTVGRVQEKYAFTTVKANPATSVKDQAASGTCWDYAGVSFVESEMLRQGKSPADLSEMFVAYHAYLDKARRYVRMHGNTAFSPGGEGNDVLDVIRRYGIVPQEAYQGLPEGQYRNDHGTLHRELTQYLQQTVASNPIRGDWEAGFRSILERHLGTPPQEFVYQGNTYTPRTFADKIVGIDPNHYVYLTSWTDSPYYEKTPLLVPDNWSWESYYNLPLDEMMSTLDYALGKGHTTIWAADISETGFSTPFGVAVVPQGYDSLLLYTKDKDAMKKIVIQMFDGPREEKTVSPQMRQKAFDDYSTVDDHSMHLTGTARDGKGNPYYLVKNSWGTQRGFNGFYYASPAYLRYKTISLVLHKDALPPEVARKLK